MQDRRHSLYEDVQHTFPQVLRPRSAQDISSHSHALTSQGLHELLSGLGRQEAPACGEKTDVQERRRSLDSWPGSVDRGLVAKAGFFYEETRPQGEGSGSERLDEVRCFHCGGAVRGWSAPCDPWHRHAELFPCCRYVNRHFHLRWSHGVLSTYPRKRLFSE